MIEHSHETIMDILGILDDAESTYEATLESLAPKHATGGYSMVYNRETKTIDKEPVPLPFEPTTETTEINGLETVVHTEKSKAYKELEAKLARIRAFKDSIRAELNKMVVTLSISSNKENKSEWHMATVAPKDSNTTHTNQNKDFKPKDVVL
jgi:hypothetical protein